MTQRADDFFAFMRARHEIYLRRQAGQSWPWTDDPILRKYSFTNCFRELDRTTQWFAKHVRDPLSSKPEVLLATVLFRWFNRISMGEALFQQTCFTASGGKGNTAWEIFLNTGDTKYLRDSAVVYCGSGPYVTGAYIILGQQGMSKLDGVLACLSDFYRYDWRNMATHSQHDELATLEKMWRWLREVPYLGDFMAYEVVTDLRHTSLLCHADDIMTWANPGPGAARGLARVYGRSIDGNILMQNIGKSQLINEMRELLAMSCDPSYWPQPHGDVLRTDSEVFLHNKSAPAAQWPAMEMRDIEHSLCEYQKYVKAQLGEGRPRAVYHRR